MMEYSADMFWPITDLVLTNFSHAAYYTLVNLKSFLPGDTNYICIDVGAHRCETTIELLEQNKTGVIIAFEPIPILYKQLLFRHPRLIALPFAIDVTTSISPFHLTAFDACSSLLDFTSEGLGIWNDDKSLAVVSTYHVQTIRLDTVLLTLPYVDYLKIDTQGNDFNVIVSAGDLIKKVKRIKTEAVVTEHQLYSGAHTKEEVINYLSFHGFDLVKSVVQTWGREMDLYFERKI